MKRWVVYALIILVLFLGAWAGYYYWQGTPRYSLYQMGRAIKNKVLSHLKWVSQLLYSPVFL